MVNIVKKIVPESRYYLKYLLAHLTYVYQYLKLPIFLCLILQ